MLHVPMAVAFEEQSNGRRSNRDVVPNLSTGSPGKDRREGQWKVGTGYGARRGR